VRFFSYGAFKDEWFDMGAFILCQLVSQASLPESLISFGGLITAIAYSWGL